MYNILIYFIKIVVTVCSLCFSITTINAQDIPAVKDSVVAKKDTLIKKEKRVVKFVKKQLQPKHLFIGIDVPKAILAATLKNRVVVEGIVETELTTRNWLTLQLGYANDNFDTYKLAYNTNTIGGLIGFNKTLFSFAGNYDYDNAFIGLGYGVSYTRIGDAKYNITDIWGTTSGTVPASNKLAHFAELNFGTRLYIAKGFIIGWRLQTKALLNNKNFANIAPLYIANYGNGDRATSINFNIMLTKKLW